MTCAVCQSNRAMLRASEQPIALINCNNVYVFCERLIDPSLYGIPVIVLSNNDGCAVARPRKPRPAGS